MSVTASISSHAILAQDLEHQNSLNPKKYKCGPYDGVTFIDGNASIGDRKLNLDILMNPTRDPTPLSVEHESTSAILDLCGAIIIGRIPRNLLSNAILSKTDLTKVDFINMEPVSELYFKAPLSIDHRYLFTKKSTIFVKYKFNGANLTEANLSGAHLSGADLTGANLTRADLRRTILTGANLTKANLTEANLTEANLAGANIKWTDLTSANFTRANLRNATFLPNTMNLAQFSDAKLEGVVGLSSIRLNQKHNEQIYGLFELRTSLWNSGFRKEAREIVYLHKYHEIHHEIYNREIALDSSKELIKVANYLNSLWPIVLFEWTTQWGARPTDALKGVIAITIGMGFIYWIALLRNAQLYIVRPVIKRIENNQYLHDGNYIATHAKLDPEHGETIGKIKYHLITIPTTAFYFSIVTSTHFGWKEINIGTWITRLQKDHYTFKPMGWLRTVSGIHSLICIYLIAIWALTQFNLLFEW